MAGKTVLSINSFPKKSYQTPTVKLLGNAKKLTLKSGSAADGFGTFA